MEIKNWLKNSWVGVVKSGYDSLGQGKLKSALYQEWIDELS